MFQPDWQHRIVGRIELRYKPFGGEHLDNAQLVSQFFLVFFLFYLLILEGDSESSILALLY